MPSLRLLFFLPFVLWACSPTAEEEHPLSANERAWWKEGIVYQVYPRSFQDTDGDGVGDLKGILQRVDYLDRLGIDIIWLNPIYGSPNDDNGYDISDYQAIMEGFGTMADFDTLLAALHDRGIRLVMDLVVNHTSDEHEWFQQSRASRDSPYRDYYHWWDAENGEPPHRAGFFDPEGKGWLYDEPTNAYYLHYFGRKQPDLKWETPKMRQEIYEMMHWWLKKGVDGFRMDVIPFISKDTTWPIVTEMELLERYQRNIWPAYYASGPNLHSYLQEMNREVLQAYDMMALGEGAGVTIDNAVDFVAKERNELDLFFHFDAVKMGYSKELGYKMLDSAWFDLIQFKDIHTQWSDVFAEQGWGSIYLGNHDQPRMVSRWGNDAPEHRAHSAKLLHTFLLSMRGTPFIYYGDELGMTNLRFDSIEQYRDIETLSWHSQLVSQGIDPAPYLEGWKITARDNGRSPFQWDDTENGGFTDGIPWLQVNENYQEINAAAQEHDPTSVLNYFRRMVEIRHAHPALVYGDYHVILPEHDHIYAYRRILKDDRMLILLNFSDELSVMSLPSSYHTGEVVINNYPEVKKVNNTITLQPYQAVIWNLD